MGCHVFYILPTVEYVAAVARKYYLKTCKKIKLTAKGTPYVSGLIRPTLVLPQKGQCPEEVILHELLHKKYGDVLVNYLLHLMRIVQWCNPLIWYVTAVIQNDSEAFCDQRVLEAVRNRDSDHNGSMPNAQKEYGSLLLDMAEHKYFGKNTIGTSNMANSGHSMKIRIRRIVDFGKVPAGIGFAALCITIILSISSIAYYDSRKSIITEGIENEADLQYAFLRAQVYEAETAQEAAYLYLKAMKEMNPMYLMAVLPEEELPALEEWILDTYRAEGFYHDESGRIYGENWIYYKGMQTNPWFIQDGSKIIQLYDDKELRDNPELANPESPVQEKLSKQEPAILSGNTGVLEKEQIEEPESSMFSSSEGVGYLTFDGAELMEGKRKMIHGSGGGYDSWKGDEILHFTAWIYCDGECVEVIRK